MRKASVISNRYLAELKKLEVTRLRIEQIHNSGQLFKRDIEFVYESLFLKSLVNLESLLEELFVGILYKKYGTKKKYNNYSFESRKKILDILLFDRNFLEWLPYSKMKARAELYFCNGKPFSNLNDRQLSFLKKSMVIRNAIAHKSKYSNEKFKSQILKAEAMPIGIKTPAQYLRYEFRTSPSKIKYEVYMSELAQIPMTITS